MDAYIIDTLRNLIAYFVERQRLVILAMLDIHPVALKIDGSRILNIDLTSYITAYQNTSASSLSKGIWKEEWEYKVHGIGCKMKNIHNGEILEWDAPNPEAIRFEWFWQHLNWRMVHDSQDPNVKVFLQWLQDQPVSMNIEGHLVAERILLPQKDGTCLLRE